MQEQGHLEQRAGDFVDMEASTIPEQEHLNRGEDQGDQLRSKAKVRITYHPMKVLNHPATDKCWETPPPADTAACGPRSVDQGSLVGLIGPWMRFWSRLCLLGVLQCPASGWGRLPWFLLRVLLAVTLLAQAVTSVSTLLSLPHGATFFIRLQACEHFSLLSLLLPALSLRAAAFHRSLDLMAHIQTMPVFSDISLAGPRRRLLFVMVVACLVFLGLQVLHVAGGLITMDFQQRQGLQGVRFALFPPVAGLNSTMVHYGVLLLQLVHLFGVYAANVLSVTTLHCINVFLYYHLRHLSNAVKTLLHRKPGTSGDTPGDVSGDVSGEACCAADGSRSPDVSRWTEILEAHSALWQLHGELQKTFSECGVVTHLAGLLDMCLTSYICIRAYSQYELSWMVLMVAVGYMLFSGLCILFESLSVDCVHSANAAIFDSNYGPSLVGLHPRELDVVRMMMQKTREPMQLNVMNIFGITMGSFGSLLSLAVTYLIIIIQFDG